MMKFKLILFLVLLFISSIKAQEKLDSIKSNPIIFGGFNIGYGNTGKRAITFGVDINHQFKNNLFTFRALQTSSLNNVDWFLFIPILDVSNSTSEFAAL